MRTAYLIIPAAIILLSSAAAEETDIANTSDNQDTEVKSETGDKDQEFCITGRETDPEGFEILSDDNIVTELRYLGNYNFTGANVRGYRDNIAVLSKTAAEALKRVAKKAAEDGYRIKIFDAYRPQTAVDNFIEWAQDTDKTEMKSSFYPDIDKKDLFKLGYLARRSGHSRGSAVDLTLIHKDGSEVDMGGTFDYFGQVSHYSYDNISDAAKKNRKYLRTIMTKEGFKPISKEWWHFSLKKEQYPGIYFNFPLDQEYITRARKCR